MVLCTVDRGLDRDLADAPLHPARKGPVYAEGIGGGNTVSCMLYAHRAGHVPTAGAALNFSVKLFRYRIRAGSSVSLQIESATNAACE